VILLYVCIGQSPLDGPGPRESSIRHAFFGELDAVLEELMERDGEGRRRQ
jgi:hypothetical protein